MARARGIKKPHPLGSVASRSGVAQLTAESGITMSTGVKISALPAAGAANDIDLLEVSQATSAGWVSRRITLDRLLGGSVAVGAEPPADPVPNSLWWNSDRGELFIWYVDADSGQWVPATPSSMGTPGTLNVLSFGAKGDGVTNDTAAFAAAIAAAEALAGLYGQAGEVIVPASGNQYMVSSLVITRAITLSGQGFTGSQIRQIAGTAAPLITIRCSYGLDAYAGLPWPHVNIRDLMLMGHSKVDAPGIDLAHGILCENDPTKEITAAIRLERVGITNFPARGITGTSLKGYVQMDGCQIYNNLKEGLYATSCNDWHIFGNTLFGVNGTDNVFVGGSTNFVFSDCDIFSAGDNNIHLYSSTFGGSHVFDNCTIDRATSHGVYYDIRRGAGTSVGSCLFSGCYFTLNSYNNADVASDFYIATSAQMSPRFVGCFWGPTRTQNAAYFAHYNVEFQSAGACAAYLAGDQMMEQGNTAVVQTNLTALLLGPYVQGPLTALNGVIFPMTAAPSTNVTTLDDYRESTWTPTIVSAGGGSPTYTKRIGYYTKIGNLVTVHFNITWTAFTGGSGAMNITGLPLASENTADFYGVVSIPYMQGMTLTANNVLGGIIAPNSQIIALFQTPVGGGNSVSVTLDTDGTLIGSATYRTAQ